MKITLIGYILIPLAFIFFVLGTRFLYYSLVFFAPFSASAVLNIKSITFGLQIPYAFAIFFFLRASLDFFKRNPKLPKILLSLFVPIIIFWIICIVSLITPIVASHKVMVHYPDSSVSYLPLEFKRLHITQLLYITFTILVMLFTSLFVDNKKKLYLTIKVLAISSIFVSIWGLYQWIGFYLGWKYPYWIFNNNIGYSQGYEQTILGIVKRISSVATEPSKLSEYYSWIFPILFILNEYQKDKIYRIALILSLIVILLSTSTTAYIWLTFFFSLYFIYKINFVEFLISFKISKHFLRTFKVVGIVIIILILFTLTVYSIFFKSFIDFDIIQNTISFITTEKFQTHSGVERVEGFIKSIYIFLQYPILGVGWGSNRSFDLNTTILSNTGILGFLFFWCFILNIVISLYKKIKNKHLSENERQLALALLFSITTGMFSHVIADPDIISLTMWIILGVSVSFLRITNASRSIKVK